MLHQAQLCYDICNTINDRYSHMKLPLYQAECSKALYFCLFLAKLKKIASLHFYIVKMINKAQNHKIPIRDTEGLQQFFENLYDSDHIWKERKLDRKIENVNGATTLQTSNTFFNYVILCHVVFTSTYYSWYKLISKLLPVHITHWSKM